MRNILIFEPFLSGHRLEYIHHLYEEAAMNPASHYYFAIPEQFVELKANYKWSEANNVSFLFLHQQEVESIQHQHKIRRISGLAGIASKLSRQYTIDEIFFISLAEYMPWLPLFFRSRAAISGIIYYIYLYEWKSNGFITRMRDALTILSVIPIKKYKHIFLLNDPVAATFLNKKFRTKKFHYLPDPYLPLTEHKGNNEDIKNRLGITDGKTVFLHFGSMSHRKGTLNILQAIASLPEEEVKGCSFVFAGKVNSDIKETFNTLTEALKEKCQILVFDMFCTPSFLSSLCEACSVILAPYYNTSYSSGIIGYAANYQKPVVVPNEKFIGKLVKRYQLGYLLKDNSPESIADFIQHRSTFPPVDGTNYMNTHSIRDFTQRTLLFE